MSTGRGGTGRRKPIPGEQYLSKREGSPYWHIDITIDSRRLRESSGTASKEDAAALATKRRDEFWREVKLGEKPKLEMTIGEAVARYYLEVGQHSTHGKRDQRYTLRLLVDALGEGTTLSALDDDRIARLVQHFLTRPAKSAGFSVGVSPSTVNRYVTALSVVCKRAREVWGAEVGPWEKSKHNLQEPEGREVFLEYEQARRLLDELCGHARPIVLFDLMTGLRRSNAIGITWEQISMDLGRAVLIQKGGRPLSVTLVPEALNLLRQVEPDPARRQGPVWKFGNPCVPCTCSHCRPKRNHGKPILSIKRAFASAVKNTGLRDLPQGRMRFHDLRHTAASWLLAAGGDLKVVQEVLGHTRIETTGRYAHIVSGRKEAVMTGAAAGLFEVPAEKKEVG